jgi:hypothetical protein
MRKSEEAKIIVATKQGVFDNAYQAVVIDILFSATSPGFVSAAITEAFNLAGEAAAALKGFTRHRDAIQLASKKSTNGSKNITKDVVTYALPLGTDVSLSALASANANVEEATKKLADAKLNVVLVIRRESSSSPYVIQRGTMLKSMTDAQSDLTTALDNLAAADGLVAKTQSAVADAANAVATNARANAEAATDPTEKERWELVATNALNAASPLGPIEAIRRAQARFDSEEAVYTTSQRAYTDAFADFFKIQFVVSALKNNDAFEGDTRAALSAMFDALRAKYETARVLATSSTADLAITTTEDERKASVRSEARFTLLTDQLVNPSLLKPEIFTALKKSFHDVKINYDLAVASADEIGKAVVDRETARNKVLPFHDLLVARQTLRTLRQRYGEARDALNSELGSSIGPSGQSFFNGVFVAIERGDDQRTLDTEVASYLPKGENRLQSLYVAAAGVAREWGVASKAEVSAIDECTALGLTDLELDIRRQPVQLSTLDTELVNSVRSAVEKKMNESVEFATFDAARRCKAYIPEGGYGARHEFDITVDGGVVLHVVIGTVAYPGPVPTLVSCEWGEQWWAGMSSSSLLLDHGLFADIAE